MIEEAVAAVKKAESQADDLLATVPGSYGKQKIKQRNKKNSC